MERMWSDAEIATIIAMWHKGASATEIGDVVHRSRNAVLGKLHRKKVTRLPGVPRPPKDRTENATSPRRASPSNRLVKLPPKPQSVPLPPKPLPPPRYGPLDGVLLVDHVDGMCAWPLAPGRCCGEPVERVRRPYCAGHAKLGHSAARSSRVNVYYIPMRSWR